MAAPEEGPPFDVFGLFITDVAAASEPLPPTPDWRRFAGGDNRLQGSGLRSVVEENVSDMPAVLRDYVKDTQPDWRKLNIWDTLIDLVEWDGAGDTCDLEFCAAALAEYYMSRVQATAA